ncbi:LytR/AlgR family response regulator transcription factor [Aquimarina rhabdastrellae]
MKNTKINCVIVEDEQHNMLLLENYIEKMDNLNLIGSFISPVQLLNFDKLSEVQIIYLDIQMPEMTGIEFLKSIATTAQIILTTAYSEYAIEGYELNITDYLLKPVGFSRFVKATSKAIDIIELQQTKLASNTTDFLMFKVDKRVVKVFVKDIIYIESDWNYIHVHTTDTKIMVLSTLKNIDEKLKEYNFVKIHKSFIINFDHFESIEGNLVQVNGAKLTVSRNYKENLLKLLY